MAPEKRTTRFGIFEIKLLFLVLLGFCVIALVTKLVYLRWESEVTLSFPEPTPEPGWNQEFEMSIDNKWIVAVSRTKRKLSRPVREKGYTVVYVPNQFDENDSHMCRAPDCIYLDPQEHRSMTFKVMKHLPKGKEESRRLIGFLYAMSRGARVIYYKNVHHNPGSSSSLPFLYSYTVMEYTLDPDSVMELRKTKFNQSSSLFVPWLIYHKFILMREGWEIPTRPPKHKGEEKTKHDSRSRPGNGFTVLHSSISSFQYKSYWALIFHTLYGGIRHALIGRLMQEITTGADFTGTPFAQVNWNPESGFSREKEAKERKRLDVILKHWECDPSLRFFSCIINIGLILSRKKIISHKYCEIIKFWTLDLIVIGAHEPVRRFHVRTTVQKLPNSTNLADAKVRLGHQAFSEACPGMTLSNNIQVIDDIALIIVFNEASLYSNIPLLESMYRGYFKHIIYCGPYLDSFTKHSTEEEITHFLFIEALKQGWHYFYECLMLASQLNIEVKGYIQIGDDTLLNPWNLKTLPRHKMWLHSGIDALNISLEETNPHWVWWRSRWGKPAVLNSLDSIFSKASLAGADSTFTSFKKTYLANSENLTLIYRQSGDFMYLPKVHVKEYLKTGSIFLNNEAMVEIAHGTIVMGIAPYNDIVFINDGSLYASDKKLTFWTSYNISDVFLHPFKLSYIRENPNVRSVFCDNYMVDSEKELLT